MALVCQRGLLAVSIPFRVWCCRSLVAALLILGMGSAVSQFPFGFGAAGHAALKDGNRERSERLNSLSGLVLPVTQSRAVRA